MQTFKIRITIVGFVSVSFSSCSQIYFIKKCKCQFLIFRKLFRDESFKKEFKIKRMWWWLKIKKKKDFCCVPLKCSENKQYIMLKVYTTVYCQQIPANTLFRTLHKSSLCNSKIGMCFWERMKTEIKYKVVKINLQLEKIFWKKTSLKITIRDFVLKNHLKKKQSW